jgi:drug/metabolite transporter (DMT)-like permease
MQRRDVGELLLLSMLWGAAYLFMRAAVPAFGPAPLIALRMAIAVAVLLPLLAWRGGLGQLRAHPVALLVQALPFTALPFLMLGYAAQHLTAGLLAVLNATAPLFAALLAHFVFHERLGRWRSAGLVIGFAGVALLTAGSVSFRSAQGLLAVGAVLLTSALWAVGANYTRRRLGGMDTLALTVGSLAVASLALAPLAAATWPTTPPPLRAWIEMAFLGVASSGLGFLLYYRLLRRIGAVRRWWPGRCTWARPSAGRPWPVPPWFWRAPRCRWGCGRCDRRRCHPAEARRRARTGERERAARAAGRKPRRPAVRG